MHQSTWARSEAGLSRLPVTEKIAGSNPVGPAKNLFTNTTFCGILFLLSNPLGFFRKKVMSTNPEIIVVGALATKVSNISSLRYTAEAISGGESQIHYVDGGIMNEEGLLSVATPSQQEAQISEIIETTPDKTFLILSQSMGALAALTTIEQFKGSRSVAGISIAPPLRYPSETLQHPRIMTMSRVINGKLILPSRSFALGDSGPTVFHPNPSTLPDPVPVIAPPELLEEVKSTDNDYLERTLAALRENKLHIIMPDHDWNEAALDTSKGLPNITSVEGPHSLITEDNLLRHNIQRIVQVAKTLER